MSRRSTVAVSTLVPALKVRSTTLPVSTFFSVVRTKAPPLPGLTCWKAVTVHSWPSMLSTRPFLRSFVVATGGFSCVSARPCLAARSSRIAPGPAGAAPGPAPSSRPSLPGPAPLSRRPPPGVRRSRADGVDHLHGHGHVLGPRLDRHRRRRRDGGVPGGRLRRLARGHLRDRQDRAEGDAGGGGELARLRHGLSHGVRPRPGPRLRVVVDGEGDPLDPRGVPRGLRGGVDERPRAGDVAHRGGGLVGHPVAREAAVLVVRASRPPPAPPP